MLDIEDVIERIEDNRHILQAAFNSNPVGTIIIGGSIYPDLEKGRIGGTAEINVIQERESAASSIAMSGVAQEHTQRIMVLFTISNQRDRTGRAAQAQIQAFRKAMLGGCCIDSEPIILGWQPQSTQTPFVLIDGGMLEPSGGIYQYGISFETTCFIGV